MDFEEIDISTPSPPDISIKIESEEILCDVPNFIETEPEIYEFDLSKYLPTAESYCDNVDKTEDFVDKEFVDKDFVDKEFVDKDFVDKDFVDKDFVGKDFVDKDFVDKDFVDKDFVDEELWDTEDKPYVMTSTELEVDDELLQSYIKIESEELLPQWENYWEEQLPTSVLDNLSSHPEVTPCRVLLDSTAVARYFSRLREEKQLENEPATVKPCQGIAELVKLRRNQRKTSDTKISETTKKSLKSKKLSCAQKHHMSSQKFKSVPRSSFKNCASKSMIQNRKINSKTVRKMKLNFVTSKRKFHRKEKDLPSVNPEILSNDLESNSITQVENNVGANTFSTVDRSKIHSVNNKLKRIKTLLPRRQNEISDNKKETDNVTRKRKITIEFEHIQMDTIENTNCLNILQKPSKLPKLSEVSGDPLKMWVRTDDTNPATSNVTQNDNSIVKTAGSPLTCLYCKLSFPNVNILFKHVVTNHDLKNTILDHLSDATNNTNSSVSTHKSNKNSHLTLNSNKIYTFDRKRIFCKYCNYLCYYEASLVHHVKMIHKIDMENTDTESPADKSHANLKQNYDKNISQPNHDTNLEDNITPTHNKEGFWLKCSSCLELYNVHTALKLNSLKNFQNISYTCKKCIDSRRTNDNNESSVRNIKENENIVENKSTLEFENPIIGDTQNETEEEKQQLYLNFYCMTCNTYHDHDNILCHFHLVHKHSFYCFLCKIFFKKSNDLCKHITNSHDENCCIYCSEIFIDITSLREHIYAKHRCKLIQKVGDEVVDETKNNVYFLYEILQIQKYIDNEDLRLKNMKKNYCFQCTLCASQLWSASYLKSHLIFTHNIILEKYQCYTCNNTFKNNEQYSTHVNKSHQNCKDHADNYKKLKCQFCNYICINTEFADKHKKIHETQVKKKLWCTYCVNYFMYKCNLIEHINFSHTCKICKLNFKYPKEKFSKNKVVYHKEGFLICKNSVENICMTQEKCNENSNESNTGQVIENSNESNTGQVIENSNESNTEQVIENSNESNTKQVIENSNESNTKQVIDISDVSCSIVKNNPYEIIYRCNFCLFMYKTEDQLIKHLKLSHKLVLGFIKCFTCDLIFKSQKNLFLHIDLKHEVISKCLYCHHYCQNYNQLCDHFKEVHPVDISNGVTTYPCEYCKSDGEDVQFISIKYLNIHISNKHKCSICKRIYRYIKDLEEHKELKHKNLEINSTFSVIMVKKNKDTASYVETVDTDEICIEKSVQCNYCGLHFKSGIELLEHKIDIHEIKNCTNCESEFNYLSLPEDGILKCFTCRNINLDENLLKKVEGNDFIIIKENNDTLINTENNINTNDTIIIDFHDSNVDAQNLNTLISDTVFEIDISNLENTQIIYTESNISCQNSTDVIIENYSDSNCKDNYYTDSIDTLQNCTEDNVNMQDILLDVNNASGDNIVNTENTALIQGASDSALTVTQIDVVSEIDDVNIKQTCDPLSNDKECDVHTVPDI